MSLATFLIVFASIVAGALFSLVLVATWCLREARDLLAAYRGFSTEVSCPRTGSPVTVHLGRRRAAPGLHVLWCERFPEGAPRCAGECFRAFAGGPAPVANGCPAAYDADTATAT